jgi:acid phosphatase (class A)
MKKLLILPFVMLAPLAAADQPSNPPAATRLGAGYLQRTAMPDALLLLGPPPADGSDVLAQDKKAESLALKMHGTPRWEQATVDADLFTPAATSAFSCAAGFVISKETTPKIDALMRKTGPDFGLSTYPAKNKYVRPRPFVGNGQPICTPDFKEALSKDGSYPSGHAAIGYGWGQLLAEIVPKRKKLLLRRGAQFADSRRICNVHFASDVRGGKVMADAVFKALKAEPAFQADLAAAKAEAKALVKAKPDCTLEQAALK